MVFIALTTTVSSVHFVLLILSALGSSIFPLIFVILLIPVGRKHSSTWYLITFLNSLAIIFLWFITPTGSQGLPLTVFILIVLGSATQIGRWQTYFFVLCSILFYFITPSLFHAHPFLISFPLLAAMVLVSIAIAETIYFLEKSIKRQFDRTKAVNEMTRSLSLSIEIHQVISLMSAAIQSTLDADTYYIGFQNGDDIDFQLFYDDGEFYPMTSFERKNTLAGWVIDHCQSLFLTDLIPQGAKLGVPITLIGKPRYSNSWMGTPIRSHDTILGLVAVASYKKNAFNQEDLELLENFAHQASISLDNAYHHAEVERKSTQDSLTATLNHGNFLKELDAEAQLAAQMQYPLSLIMLDVDYFKRYNDNYGHMVGDQVLISLADLIRRYIKSSDLVGRWGGEEFAIALPHSTGEQACMVAERIRKAMARLEVSDRDQKTIPAPTISQGIAVFPDETDQISTLIDIADQRLYVAKERGRDQVEPSSHYWKQRLL
jgi:diguanylate cyclase (GGDEF)-like protein